MTIYNIRTAHYKDSHEIRYFVTKRVGNTETRYTSGSFNCYGLSVSKVRGLAYRTAKAIVKNASQ